MNSSIKDKAIIGVDLGGTSISVGKVIEAKVILENKCNIPAQEKDENIIIDVIINTIKTIFDNDVVAIGMGVPGLVDRKKGIVYDLQNIPVLKKVHFKDILEREFNVPVFIDNDANCFAQGENIFGKAQNVKNSVGVTLGTGIGAGIINNNQLLNDLNCGSGEFGMIPYLDATLEDYCSGKFFNGKYNSEGTKIYEFAKSGDKEAIKLYKEFGFHLAQYIKILIYSIDPEKIIFGGSIINAKEFFEEEMRKELNNRVISSTQNEISIEFSEMKNSAILGASALCSSIINKN